MFNMFRTKRFRQSSSRSKFSLKGRSLRYETMEGRRVLSASGFAGNECAPEFDNAQMDTRVPGGPFSPGTNIAFSFNAADVVSDEGVGATPTDEIRFFLDPDVDANFRNNGSTPIGATLSANDPGNNDQWDFSWTPTDMQIGTYRLFIIATDLGGDGSAGPVVPLSDVFMFTIEIDNNPVVDLNGDGDGENAGIDFGPVTYTEGDGPTKIVDDDATIPFASGGTVATATIELLNPQTGDVLGVVLPDGSPLEVDASSTDSRLVLTVSGAATEADVADFEAALRELNFENTSDEPGSERRNISVTINDGVTDSEAAMTSVDTVGTNDRPVLTPDDGQLPAATVGVEYTFEVVAEDPDAGDLLTFQISDQPTPPAGVTISPNAGASSSGTTLQIARGNDGLFRATVIWTPTQADLDSGTVEIGVQVNDTGTSGITTDFEIYSIAIANQSPVGTDDPEAAPTTSGDDFAVDEDNADDVGNILANDSDPDGDALTVEAVSTTDGGASVADPTSFTTEKGALVTIDASGNVNYNPNGMFDSLAEGDSDIDEFWYTVNDGRGGVSATPANVTITVFGRNDAPRAVTTDDDPNFVIPEFQVNETDGPTALDIALVLAAALDVDQGDVVSLVGAPDDTADGTFAFTAPTNGPTSAVLEFDPADDPALIGGATKNVDVMVEVQDVAGETAMIPIRIVVTGVNVGPTANDDSATTQIDTPTTFSVTANDDDGDAAVDPATVDLDPVTAGQQTNFAVTGEGTFSVDSSGDVTFTPESDFVGTSTIRYTVNATDGETSNEAEIAVRVNDPPTAAADSAETTRNNAAMFSITDNDTDTDGTIDPATVDLDPTTGNIDIIRGVPGEGTFSVTDGTVTFVPETDFSGTVSIQYIVNDNDGATSQPATISVLVNDPPTANNDPEAGDNSYTTNEDTELVVPARGVLANDMDPDNDPLTLQVEEFTLSETLDALPAGSSVGHPNGTLQVNADGSFSFTPGVNFDSLGEQSDPATVTFTYRATDGNSLSNEATATITITGVNDPPTASPVSVSAFEDGPAVNGSFDGDDIDDGEATALTYQLTSQPSEGLVINNNDGTFIFDPEDDFQDLAEGVTRDVTFNYTATDPQSAVSDEAIATITVTGVNDAPEFDLPALATEVGGTVDNGSIRVDLARTATLTADLSMFVSDIDGDDNDIVFTRVTNNLPGEPFQPSNLPSLTQAGQLDWTPDIDLPVGEYTIRVSAADMDFQSSVIDIVVTVFEPIP